MAEAGGTEAPPAGFRDPTRGLARMSRALRYRNYRLFITGQILSLIGTWVTTTATSWLVYRLTGSAMLLGIVGFAGQMPAFVLGPVAGTYIDRWNRHRLIKVTQTISMVQSFALAALTFTDHITLTWIVALSLVQGVVNAFDMPARQSFLVSMIDDRADLGNAIALNSSIVNAARLVGPSLAGVLIAVSGEGWCFLLDGFSYVAVLVALNCMRLPAAPPKPTLRSPYSQFTEGVRYVAGFAPIRTIMLLLALVSLVGVPYTVLMPIMAAEVFRGGPYTLGLLMASSGCGALAAALWLAARPTVLGLGRLLGLAAGLFGAGLIAFSFTRVLWLAVPCLLVTGFGFMVQMASSNTVIQTLVDDEKRGRVMSLYTMAFLGTAPFGSLMAGWLSSRIGTPQTLLAGGVCCLLGSIWFSSVLPALRVEMRPIYTRLGIIPEVAEGLGQAAETSAPPEGR
jgi:MFS family permease